MRVLGILQALRHTYTCKLEVMPTECRFVGKESSSTQPQFTLYLVSFKKEQILLGMLLGKSETGLFLPGSS